MGRLRKTIIVRTVVDHQHRMEELVYIIDGDEASDALNVSLVVVGHDEHISF